jgi:mannosyl-oligosaccharide glucosidase
LNENINFGSGMDDWPRSSNGVKSKFNIDASMWGWFFADSMQKLSSIYDP